MNLKRNIGVVLSFAFLACSDQGIVSPSYEHRVLSKSFGFHDYTYNQQRLCECLGAGRTVQILIQADTVSSITPIDTISIPFQGGSYLSIESLFDLVDSQVDFPGAKVQVTYNSQYGYPERLFFDPFPNLVDDEVIYVTSNVRRIS